MFGYFVGLSTSPTRKGVNQNEEILPGVLGGQTAPGDQNNKPHTAIIVSPNNATIWPASCEKGPLDITNSVDQDQSLYDIKNTYT